MSRSEFFNAAGLRARGPFFILNLVAHMYNLVNQVVKWVRFKSAIKRKIKVCKEAGIIVDAKGHVKDPELSVIYEEYESNHSDLDSEKKAKIEKLSDSDWESRLGNTEKGYRINDIRWTDLGRKYIIMKGKKSMLPDINESIGQQDKQFHTIDDRFIDNAFHL